MIRLGLAALLLAGCGSRSSGTAIGDGGPGVLRTPGLSGGLHLAACDDPGCGGGANPPLGGSHCGATLPCRRYDTAQPRCAWIHNLEHGHGVLAYNCPTGCPELVAKLNGVWDAQQPNPTRRRLLVTPDPKLPYRMAAIVWGFGWQGDDFDAAAVDEVLSHQDQDAPEANLGCSP